MTLEDAARILRIDLNNATEEEVRRARRLLAHDMDWDNPENHDQATRVNEAFNVLKNAVSGRERKTDTVFIDDKNKDQLALEDVNAQIQNRISNLIEIFNAEKEEMINNGPFKQEELEEIQNKYNKLKEAANKDLLRLKEYQKEAEKQIEGPLGLPEKSSETIRREMLDSVNPYKKEIMNEKTNHVELKSSTPVLGITGPTLKDTPLGLPLKDKELPAVTPQKTYQDFMYQQNDRGLYQIINDLTHGLGLKKDDHKQLRASNIRIKENFKKELQSGNYLYNIVHFVPAVVKVPVQLFGKLKNHFLQDEKAKERIKTLKNRIEKLSNEDVKTIYEEYRSNRVTQEKYPTVLNDLLNSKMHEYVMREVNILNNKTKEAYFNIFSTCRKLDSINELLDKKDLKLEMRKKLQDEKENMLSGKAEVIRGIRENQREARAYFSNGLHGFEEDMKAAESKMSYVGKRFAKSYDMDEVLAAKQAQAEREENQGIRTGNDEMAFKAFVKGETLLSENTEVKNTAFGKISAGKKDYNPLAEMLNYRPDTFVKDLFTTIALSGAAVSSINGVMDHFEANEMLKKQQDANIHNEEVMNEVHQTGRDLTAKSDTFAQGMRAQTNQAINDASGTIERAALDKNNWHLGTDSYHADDALGHDFYNSLYQDTENAFAEIANEYAKGSISQKDALGAFNDIARGTQDNLNQVYTACKPIMEDYAKNHSKFDLKGSLNTMDFLVENPTAIADMNNAMFDTVTLGENLSGLTLEQVGVLGGLPSDLSTTLLGAATTAAFAVNVANSMNANEKSGKYGNEVTQMVDEYVASSKGSSVETTNAKAA